MHTFSSIYSSIPDPISTECMLSPMPCPKMEYFVYFSAYSAIMRNTPLILLILTFLSCHKSNSSSNGIAPIIHSISPDTGHYSTILTITGAHFDTTASGNLVTIDSVKAVVQNATDTTLTVMVPTTHTGKVVVTTTAGVTIGPNFIYTYDILVSGFLFNSVTGGYQSAYYWDNGVAIVLADGIYNANAEAIASLGNDIYVVGHEYITASPSAFIWKNGVATPLTGQTQYGDASAIQFSGSNIYVAGYSSNGSFNVATIWLNGTPTALTDGTTNACATSLAISGNNVYVAGYRSNGSHNVAMVWTNGVGAALSDGTYDAYATGIAVQGNDVFISGYDSGPQFVGGYLQTYWHNGVTEPLSLGVQNTGGYAEGIVIGTILLT